MDEKRNSSTRHNIPTENLLLLLSLLLLGIVLGHERVLLGLRVGLSLLVSLLHGLLELLVNGGELRGRDVGGVLSDGRVDLLVELLKVISLQVVLEVLGEVLLVVLLIVLLHLSHVVSNVLTHDAALVHLGIEGLGVSGVTRETLVAVGDIKTTITGTLHGTEHLGTGGGVLDSDVEQSTERSLLVIDLLHEVGAAVDLGGHNLTGHLLDTRVGLVEANLLEQAASQQKAGGVGGGVVLESDLKAVSGELGGRSLGQNLVTNHLSVDDLADHIAVGEADNQSVLRGLVLVLVLGDQFVALTIISAALCNKER